MTPDQILRQPCPPGWKHNCVNFSFDINQPQARVWDWLNRPETFSKGQIPPFRVEFVSPSPDLPAAFHQGVFTNHHGPGLNANGLLTRMEAPDYRELVYLYGSYVLSFRLVRPTCLQFWLEALGHDQTRVTLQLDSYVKPWIYPYYDWGQRQFWKSFRRLARKQVPRLKPRQS